MIIIKYNYISSNMADILAHLPVELVGRILITLDLDVLIPLRQVSRDLRDEIDCTAFGRRWHAARPRLLTPVIVIGEALVTRCVTFTSANYWWQETSFIRRVYPMLFLPLPGEVPRLVAHFSDRILAPLWVSRWATAWTGTTGQWVAHSMMEWVNMTPRQHRNLRFDARLSAHRVDYPSLGIDFYNW